MNILGESIHSLRFSALIRYNSVLSKNMREECKRSYELMNGFVDATTGGRKKAIKDRYIKCYVEHATR